MDKKEEISSIVDFAMEMKREIVREIMIDWLTILEAKYEEVNVLRKVLEDNGIYVASNYQKS